MTAKEIEQKKYKDDTNLNKEIKIHVGEYNFMKVGHMCVSEKNGRIQFDEYNNRIFINTELLVDYLRFKGVVK